MQQGTPLVEYPEPATEGQKCATCPNLLSPELVEDKGENVCPTCAAVFHAARTLLSQEVDDEAEIIPTLVFAKRATQMRWFEAVRTYAQLAARLGAWAIFLQDLGGKIRGVQPIRLVNNVLIWRQKSVSVEVVRYPEMKLARRLSIYVWSKSVKPQHVVELYRKTLEEHALPSHPHSRVSVKPNFVLPWLEIAVEPEVVFKTDNVGLLSKMSGKKGPVFPSPDNLYGPCKQYLASVDRRRSGGLSFLLAGRDRGEAMSPTALIPAYVAWYLGVEAVFEHDEAPYRRVVTVPAKARATTARILNQHLLEPCGMDLLPESGWSSADAVWRDVRKVERTFLKTEIEFMWKSLNK